VDSVGLKLHMMFKVQNNQNHRLRDEVIGMVSIQIQRCVSQLLHIYRHQVSLFSLRSRLCFKNYYSHTCSLIGSS